MLMDVCIDDPRRPPLVASEKNNVTFTNSKHRSREIVSRYKNGISSTPVSPISAPRRTPSPTAPRASPAPGDSVPKRALSADRKRPPSTPSTRPSTPSSRHSSPSSRHSVSSSSPSSRPLTPSSPSSRSTTPLHASVAGIQNPSRRSFGGRAPDGLWPSMRSLSTSFQSESSSFLPIKKDRAVRNPSPESRTLKPSASATSERKRTPLRGRSNSDQLENSRTVENSNARLIEQHRWPGVIGGKLSGCASSRSVDITDKVNRSASSSIPTRGASPSSSLQKSTSEVVRRAERETSLGLNVASSPSLTRPSRSQSLPITGGLLRPSSPIKAMPAPSSNIRSMQSPSRTRPTTPISAARSSVSSSVINYIADVRTGKISANHMEDVHQLRLLYNRELQWRFVNGGADATLSSQKVSTENVLFNAWSVTTELRNSVIVKRINLQKLRQEMKLDLILKGQIAYLEDCVALEKEHSSCLSGAVEALKASTLRLPVTRGARAEVREVKNAVSSAVDVMQAMGNSICFLLSRVEGTHCIAAELSKVAARERGLLDECRELLAYTAAMQVQESSLQGHLVQLRQNVA